MPKKVFIGDLTQEGLNVSANQSVWTGSEFSRYNTVSNGVFKTLFSLFESRDANDLPANVVFVNAHRASHRVGPSTANIINAIVQQEILNYSPWVREADGEPASKKPRSEDEVQRKDSTRMRDAEGEPARKRPRTEDEVQRKDTISPLRPLLRGNENRRDIPKVFFDVVFQETPILA